MLKCIDEILLETLLQYNGQLTYGCIDNQIPEIQEQVYIRGYSSSGDTITYMYIQILFSGTVTELHV